ncbi:MAG TPA: YafY family transcriptional regulator [Clostridiaceae bacterium]|nr:YafY family transcriptional regulator [Clostridiaceae bacterium]
MKMNRLFEIIYILMNKNTITAKELADRFEVSQRTIYRDIDILSLAGIPVYTSKGKGGGISLVKNFVLDKSILSEKEQSEILSALHALIAINAAETNEVLNRLSSFFNKDAVQWIEVDFSNWGNRNSKIFSLLKTAILNRRIVEFDYYSSYGEKTHRRVEPVRLCFKDRAWYIKSFCLTRNSFRTFKLMRIKNLTLTNENYKQRDLFSGMSESNSVSKNKVTLKLKIAPEMTYRVYDEFDEYLIVKNSDGSHTVTVTWPEDEWVYGFILSFGEYIEVLEPEHIKNIIKEKLKKSLGKYL